jgi:putative membrane protein insertion efficiency factor
VKNLALLVIRGYQLVLSPFFGGQCRFYPSCSVYTREAIEKYGVLKGAFLGAKRLLKCHPLHSGGVDYVP